MNNMFLNLAETRKEIEQLKKEGKFEQAEEVQKEYDAITEILSR
jgi:copper(I)-binding protein